MASTLPAFLATYLSTGHPAGQAALRVGVLVLEAESTRGLLSSLTDRQIDSRLHDAWSYLATVRDGPATWARIALGFAGVGPQDGYVHTHSLAMQTLFVADERMRDLVNRVSVELVRADDDELAVRLAALQTDAHWAIQQKRHASGRGMVTPDRSPDDLGMYLFAVARRAIDQPTPSRDNVIVAASLLNTIAKHYTADERLDAGLADAILHAIALLIRAESAGGVAVLLDALVHLAGAAETDVRPMRMLRYERVRQKLRLAQAMPGQADMISRAAALVHSTIGTRPAVTRLYAKWEKLNRLIRLRPAGTSPAAPRVKRFDTGIGEEVDIDNPPNPAPARSRVRRAWSEAAASSASSHTQRQRLVEGSPEPLAEDEGHYENDDVSDTDATDADAPHLHHKKDADDRAVVEYDAAQAAARARRVAGMGRVMGRSEKHSLDDDQSASRRRRPATDDAW